MEDPKEHRDRAFAIGGTVWPGTSKVLEEMGELQQVLGKLIQTGGDARHWDGDLRPKIVEEIADVLAALDFFAMKNLTAEENVQVSVRFFVKCGLFRGWHQET